MAQDNEGFMPLSVINKLLPDNAVPIGNEAPDYILINDGKRTEIHLKGKRTFAEILTEPEYILLQDGAIGISDGVVLNASTKLTPGMVIKFRKTYEQGKRDALNDVLNRMNNLVSVMSIFFGKECYQSSFNFITTSMTGVLWGNKEQAQLHVDSIRKGLRKIIMKDEGDT